MVGRAGKNRRWWENLSQTLSPFFYKKPLCFVKSSVTMAIKKDVELVCPRLFNRGGSRPPVGCRMATIAGRAGAATVCERGYGYARSRTSKPSEQRMG